MTYIPTTPRHQPVPRKAQKNHVEAVAGEYIDRLRSTLRRELRARKTRDSAMTRRALSLRLGRHPNYWGKALRGEGKLLVQEVCTVLDHASLSPADFFLAAYPPGGSTELALKAQAPDLGDAHMDTAALDEVLRRHAPRLRPEDVVEGCRELLRGKIRSSPYSQKDLSRLLGMRSPRALGQALWGSTALTFEHVFRVLAALDVEPALFFFQVFDPQEGDIAPGLSLEDVLTPIHQLHHEATAALAETAKLKSETAERRTAERRPFPAPRP